MIYCKECKIKFSNTSNLRAHVRRKHPEKLSILAPKTRNQSGSHICSECGANFVNFGNLRAHVGKKHPGKMNVLAPIKMRFFECNQCCFEFNTRKDLRIHKKTHAVIKTPKCPLCEYSDSATNLIDHYKDKHSIQIETESLEFESFEAFQTWKSKVERETFASFVNMHGTKQRQNIKKIKYTCHRSGEVRRRGSNIRSFKAKGSNKINAYCPAEMTVKAEETKCIVSFCKTHIGHEQDLDHLFLSASDRQNIAAKIAANIPMQTILDEIRQSDSNSQLKRLHLLTKKDLYNIKHTFNLNELYASNTEEVIIHDWENESESGGSDFSSEESNQDTDAEETIEAEKNEAVELEKLLSTNKIPAQNDLEQQIVQRKQDILEYIQDELSAISSMEEIEKFEEIIAELNPCLATIRNQQINDMS